MKSPMKSKPDHKLEAVLAWEKVLHYKWSIFNKQLPAIKREALERRNAQKVFHALNSWTNCINLLVQIQKNSYYLYNTLSNDLYIVSVDCEGHTDNEIADVLQQRMTATGLQMINSMTNSVFLLANPRLLSVQLTQREIPRQELLLMYTRIVELTVEAIFLYKQRVNNEELPDVSVIKSLGEALTQLQKMLEQYGVYGCKNSLRLINEIFAGRQLCFNQELDSTSQERIISFTPAAEKNRVSAKPALFIPQKRHF